MRVILRDIIEAFAHLTTMEQATMMVMKELWRTGNSNPVTRKVPLFP